MIKILINQGAKTDAINNEGDTALHVAAATIDWLGFINVKQLIEEAHADLNIKNARGQTARDIAASKNNEKIVSYLDEVAAKRTQQDVSTILKVGTFASTTENEKKNLSSKPIQAPVKRS